MGPTGDGTDRSGTDDLLRVNLQYCPALSMVEILTLRQVWTNVAKLWHPWHPAKWTPTRRASLGRTRFREHTGAPRTRVRSRQIPHACRCQNAETAMLVGKPVQCGINWYSFNTLESAPVVPAMPVRPAQPRGRSRPSDTFSNRPQL
jgi:hypothetical protein